MKQAPPSVSGKLTAAQDMRLKGGAMETIYISVDFHARQQTICYLKTETGELVFHELKHQDKQQVRAFYAQFVGQVIVGLEASGYIDDLIGCTATRSYPLTIASSSVTTSHYPYASRDSPTGLCAARRLR